MRFSFPGLTNEWCICIWLERNGFFFKNAIWFENFSNLFLKMANFRFEKQQLKSFRFEKLQLKSFRLEKPKVKIKQKHMNFRLYCPYFLLDSIFFSWRKCLNGLQSISVLACTETLESPCKRYFQLKKQNPFVKSSKTPNDRNYQSRSQL